MMCLLVYAQKNERMPRLVSLVTGLAFEGSSIGPTHTLSTPLTGARNANCAPSELMRADALSGLPNSSVRGISTTSLTAAAAAPGVGFSALAAELATSVGCLSVFDAAGS